jgi:hypothetical protein
MKKLVAAFCLLASTAQAGTIYIPTVTYKQVTRAVEAGWFTKGEPEKVTYRDEELDAVDSQGACEAAIYNSIYWYGGRKDPNVTGWKCVPKAM